MSHFVSLPFKAELVGPSKERNSPITVIGFTPSEYGPLAIVVWESGRLGWVEVKFIELPSHEPATEIP